MHYQFAKERLDYSDLASGRVFYSLPGHPAFPIRLADEILQRCLARREANHVTGPCVLYDPCCGTAYHLSVLAYLHWRSLRGVIGSDIDYKAVNVAQKNLGLLSLEGLGERIDEISEMLRRYGKESHKDALGSAHRLRDRIGVLTGKYPLKTRVFQANALDGEELREHLKGIPVDIVFADIPYGLRSHWHNPDSKSEFDNSLWLMLDALLGVMVPTSVVAVVSDKRQKAAHEGYQRVEHFQIGKRRVVLLKPIAG
jgi:23S rRNA (guanine2535-N1)-methyltransferase